MDAVEHFVKFYKKLDNQSLTELALLYSDNIVFVDPVRKHQGLPAMRHYFAQLHVHSTYYRLIRRIPQSPSLG